MTMIDALIFTVAQENVGKRIDKLIVEIYPNITRSAIQKIITQGGVRVNDILISKNHKANLGDIVKVIIPQPKPMEAVAQDIDVDVRFEDEDLLVVNKPRGMVVHPAVGNYDGTLVNALLNYCGDSLSGINGVIRPGIVHRIDKDTSGLLIVAKNDFAHKSLAAQIKEHSFLREYQAVVHGHFKDHSGTIDAPIGRSTSDRKRMMVTIKNSRNAVSHYEVVESYKGFTHINVRLETGRTHQIRVHMAYIGHPVAGDKVYGPKNTPTYLGGQCLHAGLIGFEHPRDGRYIEVRSELPEYFQNFLIKINK